MEKCDVSLGTHAALGERLKEADLVDVARQVCCALRHVHAHGVAHLDLKPDNIYLQVGWRWGVEVALAGVGVGWGRACRVAGLH